MSSSTQVILADPGPSTGSGTGEDDLRLPRPPGVMRRFWATHPRFADVLIVMLVVLFGIPSFLLTRTDLPGGAWHPFWLTLSFIVTVTAALSLLWRRRYPLTVYIVAALPLAVFTPAVSGTITGAAAIVALCSLAVYRSSRAAMWTLAATIGCTILAALGWWALRVATVNDVIAHIAGTTILLLIGALIGVNVGNRKRYVDALIERSRRLAVERDQQAQLATAAERTRIAREMHDIVSHSLTVVVALAEGVHATDDPERAKQASRAIADTARESLAQMRVMLGVLRTDAASDASGVPGEVASSPNKDNVPRQGHIAPKTPYLEPLSLSETQPLLAQTPADVVARARDAGLPVTLTVTGTPGGSPRARLAVLRVVQEGLTNALRYAHDPSRVHVTISYVDDSVRVRIENDGVRAGEESRGAGLGIRGLQERVGALDGTVHAGPAGETTWVLEAEFDGEERDD